MKSEEIIMHPPARMEEYLPLTKTDECDKNRRGVFASKDD